MEPFKRKLVTTCPVCDGVLRVTHLACERCGSVLQAEFDSCPYCRLPQELADFLAVFIRCEGVIREIEREIGVSYPAVKNRIRRLISALGMGPTETDVGASRTEEILEAVKEGDLSVKKAIQALRTQRR